MRKTNTIFAFRLKDDNYLEMVMSMLLRISHCRNPGDNITKARVSLGLARCFATAAKFNKSPHVTERILSFVKGINPLGVVFNLQLVMQF